MDIETLAVSKSYTDKQIKNSGNGSGGISVKDAKVGQLIRAKAVDATGNITEYEPVSWGYEEKETVTFPEQEVSGFSEIDPTHMPGCYALMSDPTYTIPKNGEQFQIKWDGIEYTSIAFVKTPTIFALGNLNILNPNASDTGEPYLFMAEDGEIGWLTKSTASSHTIGVAKVKPVALPIPNKFAPKDWNENDPNAPGYIQNRICYEEMKGNITFPEAEVSGFAEFQPGTYGLSGNPTNTTLIERQTYKIKWDGTDYACAVKLFEPMNNALYIGNAGIIGGQESAEPFFFSEADGGILVTKSPVTSHTIQVTTFRPSAVKIPEKFLPEKMLTVEVTQVRQEPYKANKTFSEIKAALDAGAEARVIYSQRMEGTSHSFTKYLRVTKSDYKKIIFMSSEPDIFAEPVTFKNYYCIIKADGTIQADLHELA